MTEPVGDIREDLNTTEVEELSALGLQCDSKACSEVMKLLQQCIAETQKLARDGYQINLPAIARQLANTKDVEDWNLLITAPLTDSYAQFVATVNSIGKRVLSGYQPEDANMMLRMYHRSKEEVVTKIGDCIGLLIETKQKLYGKKMGFRVSNVDKLIQAFNHAITA